jgi:hypothetical protein
MIQMLLKSDAYFKIYFRKSDCVRVLTVGILISCNNISVTLLIGPFTTDKI